jgi:hypothetical protein
MRVIVTGAVAWSDEAAIRRELSKLPAGTTVIHGDCAGADEIAGRVARELGFSVEPFAKSPDDYARAGRAAWRRLNERMLESGADLVLGFHPDLSASEGTRHMADLARKAGVEVRTFES